MFKFITVNIKIKKLYLHPSFWQSTPPYLQFGRGIMAKKWSCIYVCVCGERVIFRPLLLGHVPITNLEYLLLAFARIHAYLARHWFRFGSEFKLIWI